MKRWSFLILDANVIIVLFKWGIWDRVVEVCDLQVSETVIGEAHFFEDDAGARHDFDLSGYTAGGRIRTFGIPPKKIKDFVDTFDPSYIEKLDAGEAESLAYLMTVHDEHFICSADAIVYRVLGNLDRGHQGTSLEEVLAKVGLGRPVPWQFSKAFRERFTGQGVREGLQGRGSRRR